MTTGPTTSLITGPLHRHLSKEMTKATELTICVAFLKASALYHVESHIRGVLARGGKVTIVAGRDFYLTEPKALWTLFRMFEPYHPRASLYLMEQGSTTYHPKMYIIVSGRRAALIVGSSNMTSGGLNSNVEVSLLQRSHISDNTVRKSKAFAARLMNSARCKYADGVDIGLYERKYEAYHQEHKKFEKKAKRAITDIHDFSTTKMLRYLRQYQSDEEHQENWAQKQRNYREARKVLDGMLKKRSPSKAQFLEEYEKLVGASGGIKLWHSGSVFRSKQKVAARHRRFIKMVRALKKRLGASPEEMFEIGRSHAKSIPGLGPNVLTEVLNTYDSKRYAVLNKNPVGSLKGMGLTAFPSPQLFSPEKYAEFVSLLKEVTRICQLKNLSHADHFCNYVYWQIKND